MMKTRLAISALVIAGLAGMPFGASAMTTKHPKRHPHHMTTTTGANMKPSSETTTGQAHTTTSKTPAPATK